MEASTGSQRPSLTLESSHKHQHLHEAKAKVLPAAFQSEASAHPGEKEGAPTLPIIAVFPDAPKDTSLLRNAGLLGQAPAAHVFRTWFFMASPNSKRTNAPWSREAIRSLCGLGFAECHAQ